MRDIEKLSIQYVGYSSPLDEDEIVLEILGLELSVKDAERRIALLKQSVKYAAMVRASSPESTQSKESSEES